MAASGSTSSTSSSGRAMVVASTTFAANSGWRDSGTASVTRPTPARPAARHVEQGRARVVQRARDHEQSPERALVAADRSLGQERRRQVVIEADRALRPGSLGLATATAAVAVARRGCVATAEAHRTPLRHDRPPRRLGRGASDARAAAPPASAASRRRSIRARIRRSRSSSRASMSSGKTYRPPAVRTPNAIATAKSDSWLIETAIRPIPSCSARARRPAVEPHRRAGRSAAAPPRCRASRCRGRPSPSTLDTASLAAQRPAMRLRPVADVALLGRRQDAAARSATRTAPAWPGSARP